MKKSKRYGLAILDVNNKKYFSKITNYKEGEPNQGLYIEWGEYTNLYNDIYQNSNDFIIYRKGEGLGVRSYSVIKDELSYNIEQYISKEQFISINKILEQSNSRNYNDILSILKDKGGSSLYYTLNYNKSEPNFYIGSKKIESPIINEFKNSSLSTDDEFFFLEKNNGDIILLFYLTNNLGYDGVQSKFGAIVIRGSEVIYQNIFKEFLIGKQALKDPMKFFCDKVIKNSLEDWVFQK